MEWKQEESVQHSNETKRTKGIISRPLKRSKVTRVIYVLYIVIFILLCMIILTPKVIGFFQRIFCHSFNYYYCDLLVGYDAVYRLGFALAIWFIILGLATLGVTTSSEQRARVQNGCWVAKTIGLIFLELLFVLIPHYEYNGEIWLFFGLNAAFCYIILQYTFILDAANSFCILSGAITEPKHGSKFSNYTIKLFRIAKTFTTVFLYSVSLLTSVGFYFIYASYYECLDNFFFLTFHLVMCFASSVISVLPIVRESSPQAGLFQCAVTSLYCTYIIWLAFSSEPRHQCNPSDLHRFPGSPMANIQVWVTLIITFSTLIFISVRDLVTPQFGKVEKLNSTIDATNKLSQTYNLRGGEDKIPQTFKIMDVGSPRQNDKFMTRKIPEDCENNKLCHPRSKVDPVVKFLNGYCPGVAPSEVSTSEEPCSENTAKNAVIESGPPSLAWDNTLFLSSTSKEASESLNANEVHDTSLQTSSRDSSKTPFAPKDETQHAIREDFMDSTGTYLRNTSAKRDTNISERSLMESKVFTTKGTQGLETNSAVPKDETEPLAREATINTTGKQLTNTSPRTQTNSSETPLMECSDLRTKDLPLIWDDEVEGIEYSYSFFHLTFSLATLYLIMSITNWYRLDEGEHLTVRLVQSWSAVWLRISASIFCSFILIWSMVIPLVFPDSYMDLLFFQYLTSLPKY